MIVIVAFGLSKSPFGRGFQESVVSVWRFFSVVFVSIIYVHCCVSVYDACLGVRDAFHREYFVCAVV